MRGCLHVLAYRTIWFTQSYYTVKLGGWSLKASPKIGLKRTVPLVSWKLPRQKGPMHRPLWETHFSIGLSLWTIKARVKQQQCVHLEQNSMLCFPFAPFPYFLFPENKDNYASSDDCFSKGAAKFRPTLLPTSSSSYSPRLMILSSMITHCVPKKKREKPWKCHQHWTWPG